MSWPQGNKLITFRLNKSAILKDDLEEKEILTQIETSREKKRNKSTRHVKVYLVNMEWFYERDYGFESFSDLLTQIPD